MIFAALLAGFPSLKAQQNTGEIRVGVVAGVDPATKKNRAKAEASATTTFPKGSYTLALVRELSNEEKLIAPVDAGTIAKKVARELEQQGFTRARPPGKPDYVITVDYGRGYPPNPYTDEDANGNRTITDNLSDTRSIGSVRHHKTYVGLEEKIQRASYEKLFIRMTAWKYPDDPKEKPTRLWRTLMNVDDPDHRDLTIVAEAMLAAGGPFFNQETKIDEAEITQPLPDGKVDIGESVEVAPVKK